MAQPAVRGVAPAAGEEEQPAGEEGDGEQQQRLVDHRARAAARSPAVGTASVPVLVGVDGGRAPALALLRRQRLVLGPLLAQVAAPLGGTLAMRL